MSLAELEQAWVLFEVTGNGTRLLRGIYTAPDRAQKGLDTMCRLYEATMGRRPPKGFYEVLPSPLDTVAWS